MLEQDNRKEYLVTAANGKYFIWAIDEEQAKRIAIGSRGAKTVIEIREWNKEK